MMKKFVILVIGLIFTGVIRAQHASMEQMSHHDMPFTKPDAAVANTIIWVSVGVVVVTLLLTLKYLFKPRESNPDHIKNIVKDEGF